MWTNQHGIGGIGLIVALFFFFFLQNFIVHCGKKDENTEQKVAVCFVGMKSKKKLLSDKIVKQRTNNKTKMIIFSCLTLIMFCNYPSLRVLHLHLRFL